MDVTQSYVPTQPLPFEDFSGGKTDYYLGGPLNKYEEANNLLIVKHGRVGKLFTRPGSEIYDSTYYQIPAGAQRIGTLKYFESVLFYHSARKLYYVNSGWVTLQGPSGNDLFPSGVDTTTVVSTATWNKHLYLTSSDLTQKVQKVYKDGSATWRLRTAGMPALASSPTATPDTTGVASVSYLYRFLYRYGYAVGTVAFEDRGPTTEVTAVDASGSEIAGGTPCAIASIPVLANGSTHNYDTASAELDVEIYRTTNGGQNFFYVGSVNNGTTTYSDTTTDANLQLNAPLYTEGGEPEHTEPPYCKVVHVVDDRGYFGHCKVGSEVLANRVYQSIPGSIDAVPDDFFVDLSDAVVGISSARSNPIVCGEAKIFRLDGAYDELGQGFIIPTTISETAGCVSSSSLVQTLEGLYWAGVDGFYYSDGYQVIRISDDIDQTYQTLITTAERKRRIVGKFDSKKNRIYWTVQSASDASDVDACYVLDLNWGLSTNMPFTTVSGGANFAPTAIEFIGANLIRGDSRGYTFIHRDTLYVDPKVNTAAAPSTWNSATIVSDFISIATDFGTTFERKWVPRVGVICKNETNLSLQITSINDDGRRRGDLSPIRYRGNVTWGDPDVYWGDPDVIWNAQGVIDEGRRMPAGGLRCSYKQIELTNALVAIVTSDLIGTATVDSAAHTATLDNTAAYDWPSGSVDYYLAFDIDDYTKEYLVTARTADVLTFTDTSSSAPSGSRQWVLRGKPKGEVLHLISFTLHYAVFGKTQSQYRKTGTGEVGADD